MKLSLCPLCRNIKDYRAKRFKEHNIPREKHKERENNRKKTRKIVKGKEKKNKCNKKSDKRERQRNTDNMNTETNIVI